MNALDGSLRIIPRRTPKGQDLLVTDSRVDLLENKVTLTVPEGNPKGIESFDQLAELLKGGEVLLAIGNSDVPVGQYTLKIFNYYGIDETAVADKLTYGNNVKEVTSQVSEGAVDCGIIYATDAHSAGLTVVDSATAEMCGQVIYPRRRAQGGQGGRRARLPRLSPDRCRYDRIRVRRLQPRDLSGFAGRFDFVEPPSYRLRSSGRAEREARQIVQKKTPAYDLRNVRQVRQFGVKGQRPCVSWEYKGGPFLR